MAVPKGRVSKSKRDKRKAQSWKIATPNLVKCSKCGELMVPHQVCKACGAQTATPNRGNNVGQACKINSTGAYAEAEPNVKE